MRITHVAVWTQKLDEMRDFYIKYFNGKSNEKYVNEKKGFESYFITFEGEVSLELMKRTDITEHTDKELIGICHLALSVKNKTEVLNLTEKFRHEGYTIVGEPRLTGDGFFESVIFDPDRNRIELVAESLD